MLIPATPEELKQLNTLTDKLTLALEPSVGIIEVTHDCGGTYADESAAPEAGRSMSLISRTVAKMNFVVGLAGKFQGDGGSEQ